MRRFDNRKEFGVGQMPPVSGIDSVLTMFLKGAPVFGKNRRTKFAAFGALIALGFIVFQGVGGAHNPEIQAKAECIVPTDRALITIDVQSWTTDEGDDHRTNDVVLTVTGPGFNQTYNHRFEPANNFEFTRQIEVAADGKTYTATATTDGSWGPNNDIIIPIGAQSRSATVTVPQPCIPTTTEAPTLVEGVVQTVPPTTVVGTAVQGVVLARTGTNAMPLVIGGVMLVLLGTAVELNARRRRSA